MNEVKSPKKPLLYYYLLMLLVLLLIAIGWIAAEMIIQKSFLKELMHIAKTVSVLILHDGIFYFSIIHNQSTGNRRIGVT